MKSNGYIGIVTVKAVAPAGHKPRSTSYKLGYLGKTNKEGFKKKIEEEALKLFGDAIREVNPDIDIRLSVTSEIVGIWDFSIMDNGIEVLKG